MCIGYTKQLCEAIALKSQLSPMLNISSAVEDSLATEISDLTPLYGLELERLRCVLTNVPQEQLDEYARLHPDCQMLLKGYMPHENGWRYDEAGNKVPRYALLQEQMEYAIDSELGIP